MLRRGILVLLAVCCAMPAWGRDKPPAPPVPPALTAYTSRHYLVNTNLSRDEARLYGAHMDAVFEEYSRRFASFPSRGVNQMPLYLLRSQEEYLNLLARFGVNGANTGGIFFIRDSGQGLATWTQKRSATEAFAVLQHEGFHQFAFNYVGPDLPIWVNEGLAQYFEDGILTGEKMHVGFAPPRRIDVVRSALRLNRAIDFDRLLSISNEQWQQELVDGGDQANLLYQQSWSVVYFLIVGDGGKYRGAFERYLHLVAQGRASEAAFKEAFQTNNTGPFRRRWEQFAAALEPDAVSLTVQRMRFLGEGLKFLQGRGERAPGHVQELKRRLQAIQFRLVRTEDGIDTEFKAADDALFRYPRGNSLSAFELLAPPWNGAPPRLTAPGISPQPLLSWTRSDAGPAAVVEYR